MMNHRTPPGCAKVELAPLVLIKIPGAEAWGVAGSGGAQPALRQYPGERCPSLIGIDARKCVPGQAASEVGWLVVRIQKALFEEQMRVDQRDAYGKRAVGSDLVRQRGLKPIRLQRGARPGEAPYELRVRRVAVVEVGEVGGQTEGSETAEAYRQPVRDALRHIHARHRDEMRLHRTAVATAGHRCAGR